MASVVGICNSALIKLGASTVMSLTDGSKNANLCNAQYARLRDELLRSHNWNFASTRRTLAQLSDIPAFGFDHAYQLPSDWLRTVSVHDNEAGDRAVRYKIEGRRLLCSAPRVYLRYVRQVTDPNEMDVAFRETLAWKIAADLAIPVVQSTTTREQMTDGFDASLARARAVDAIEDFPEPWPGSDWVMERH